MGSCGRVQAGRLAVGRSVLRQRNCMGRVDHGVQSAAQVVEAGHRADAQRAPITKQIEELTESVKELGSDIRGGAGEARDEGVGPAGVGSSRDAPFPFAAAQPGNPHDDGGRVVRSDGVPDRTELLANTHSDVGRAQLHTCWTGLLQKHTHQGVPVAALKDGGPKAQRAFVTKLGGVSQMAARYADEAFLELRDRAGQRRPLEIEVGAEAPLDSMWAGIDRDPAWPARSHDGDLRW